MTDQWGIFQPLQHVLRMHVVFKMLPRDHNSCVCYFRYVVRLKHIRGKSNNKSIQLKKNNICFHLFDLIHNKEYTKISIESAEKCPRWLIIK